MIWARRILVGILAVFLLISLLGASVATSARYSLSNPGKIESWLKQSDFYGGVINKVVAQAQPTINSQSSAATTAVKQAAESALAPNELYHDTRVFLNANYAWLEGHDKLPTFTIDLTSTKQSFATQVGSYAQSYLAGLQACSAAQTAQLVALNPLSLSCLPSSISPSTAGSELVSEINLSNVFGSNPVLNASNISAATAVGNGAPYYQRLSNLPKAYQWGMRVGWILLALCVIIALAIIFIASRKRRGLKVVGIVLLIGGLILVATDSSASRIDSHINRHINYSASLMPLKQSLNNFADLVAKSITRDNMRIGLVYIVIALIVLLTLLAKGRRSKPKTPVKEEAKSSEERPSHLSNFRLDHEVKPLNRDNNSPLSKPGGPSSPQNTRKRNLIQ